MNETVIRDDAGNIAMTIRRLQADGDEGRLQELASIANAEHHASERGLSEALQHAIQAGSALLEAKKLCKHGRWLPWLRVNFEGCERTARYYMKVAQDPPAIPNRQRDADMSMSLRDAIGQKSRGATAFRPQTPIEKMLDLLTKLALTNNVRGFVHPDSASINRTMLVAVRKNLKFLTELEGALQRQTGFTDGAGILEA